MQGMKVVVLGGTGFVGRAVVNELSKNGYETTCCVRRPERHREFGLFPKTRVVELFEMTGEALQRIFSHQDIVINLLGDVTLGSEAIEINQFAETTQKIKQACDHAGIQRVLQLSQIGANGAQIENAYLASLGEADSVILNSKASVTILKMGLLLGEGDESAFRFSKQLDRLPLLPIYHGGREIQPLSVADFAKAMVLSISQASMRGQKFELVGESRLTLKGLGQLVAEIKGQEEAVIVPMCGVGAGMMSFLGGFAPVCSVSTAQRLILSCDLGSEQDFASQFGFEPKSIELTLASYVLPHHIRERYNYFRQEAGRDVSELI